MSEQQAVLAKEVLVAEPGYERMVAVFRDAHNQAAHGKGKERHANDLPFEAQRMLSICRLQGSPDGMAYQVIKKVTEGLAMPEHHRKVAELYGAINYLAGIVIFLEDLQGEPGPPPTPDELATAEMLRRARETASTSCETCNGDGVVPMNGGQAFAPCADCRP
jgi:hypothetical protein